LCSLGTVEQGRDRVAKRFLRRLVDEFAEDPRFTVILAAGDARMADAVGPPPSNVHVFLSVPQMRVLREADVMITHGGSSSVKECIAMGVPLLVFPRRADQPGNAARVEYHGLGLKGSMRFDRGPAIRRKVERLLTEPHFQRNLSAMRDRFDRYRGVGVAILEYYLGKPASDVASPPMHSSTFGEGGASSR
jgi:zeaxanthin glucosyltransferase